MTENAFLGGAVRLLQPKSGYRAGIDPVLLAASIPARPGQSVLELGCGGGVGLLCLAARVPDLALTGVERQPGYADLARRNAALNGYALDVVEADVVRLPPALRQRLFHHVLANPPYFDPSRRSPANDPGREAGLAGETPIGDWIDAGARRLRPGGTFSMIVRVEQLPELLTAMSGQLGSIVVQPFAARAGRPANLLVARGVKGGRAPFRLNDPVILHSGLSHERDGEDFCERIQAVLRDGKPLEF